MLLSITGPASDAIRAVFLRTRDDLLVLACLRGFRSHARACVYLGLVTPFDKDLVFLFRRGLEYASAAAEGVVDLPLPGGLSVCVPVGYIAFQSLEKLGVHAAIKSSRLPGMITELLWHRQEIPLPAPASRPPCDTALPPHGSPVLSSARRRLFLSACLPACRGP